MYGNRGPGPGSISMLFLVASLSHGAAIHSAWSADPEPGASGWKIEFDGSKSRPAIAAGLLYVGSADGAVYALDPGTGQTRWRFQTGAGLPMGGSGLEVVTVPRDATPEEAIRAGLAATKKAGTGRRRVDATPVIDRGTVFIASADLFLYAIDAVTGAQKWSFEAKETVHRATVRNGIVYFVTSAGLHALDADTGQQRWRFETLRELPIERMNMGRKRPPLDPAIEDSVIYLTAWPYRMSDSTMKCYLYALDRGLGEPKWVVVLDGLDISAPVAANGLVLVSAKAPSSPTHPAGIVSLVAIEAAGGRVRWKFDAPIAFDSQPLWVADSTVCFGTDQGVFALDLATGQARWSFRKDEVTSIWAGDRSVYAVTHQGSFAGPRDRLHALALSDGRELWSQGVSGNAHIVGIESGVVYTLGVPRLQAIDAGTGKVRWSFKGVDAESSPLITDRTIFVPAAAQDMWPTPDPKPTLFRLGKKKQVEHQVGHLYAIDAASGKAGP